MKPEFIPKKRPLKFVRIVLSLMLFHLILAETSAQQTIPVVQNKDGFWTRDGGQQVIKFDSIDAADDGNDRITFYADDFLVVDPDDGTELFDARLLKRGDYEIASGNKLIFNGREDFPVVYELWNFNGNFIIDDKTNVERILEYIPNGTDGRGQLELHAQVLISGDVTQGSGAHKTPAQLSFQNDVNELPDSENSWNITVETNPKMLVFSNDLEENHRFGLTRDHAFFKGDGLEIWPNVENENEDKGVYLNFRPQGYRNWQMSILDTDLDFYHWVGNDIQNKKRQMSITQKGVTIGDHIVDKLLKFSTTSQSGANIYRENDYLKIGAGTRTVSSTSIGKAHIYVSHKENEPVVIRHNPINHYTYPAFPPEVKDGFALVVEKGILSADLAITEIVWADYVFEEDYQPMPLEELERFVKEEKHLPGIVSESEIEEDGFYQVHDAMVGQLKNLEEQVLHNIAQEKTIKEQAAQIKNLTQKLDQLEKLVQQLADETGN